MNYSLFYDAHISFYYLWNIAHLLLTILSLYSALVPFSIPNISLISYGLSLVCLWQTMPQIFDKGIGFIARKSDAKQKFALCVFLHAAWLLYTGIVSAASNFFLFPHPGLHIFLSICIYFIGFMLSLFLFCMAFYLSKGELNSALQSIYERQMERKNQILRWVQSAKEKKEIFQKESREEIHRFLENMDKKRCFEVRTFQYLFHRVFSIALWLMIPVWVFVLIPLRSFSSWQELPLFYSICMVATIVWGIFWVSSFFLRAMGKYYISEQGMIIRNFCLTKIFFWHEVKFLQIEEDSIKIQKFQGREIQLLFQDLENPKDFFLKLQDFLPLSIFFIEPSGWKALNKIMPEEASEIEAKYQNIYEGIPSENNKKKSKK